MYDKKVKKKIPLSNYFWLFIVCSFLGTVYEEVLHIACHLFKYHEFNWSRRSGLFFTPLNPVYGFGAVILLFLLGRRDRAKWKTYLGASFIGGIGEYMMSLIQEWLTGTTSWDYSDKFLNIHGRTTVIYMLYWGLAGLLLIEWLYPKMVKLLKKMPERIYKILSIVLLFIVSIDIIVTWTAVIRKELRDKGNPPHTIIGEFCDKHFGEEFIEKRYPNMEEKE